MAEEQSYTIPWDTIVVIGHEERNHDVEATVRGICNAHISGCSEALSLDPMLLADMNLKAYNPDLYYVIRGNLVPAA